MKRSPACTPQPEVQPLFFDLDLVKEEIPENEIKKEDISQFETFEHIFIKNEFNNETTLNTSKINQVQEQESVQVRQEWNSLLYNVYEEIEITVDDIKPEIIESRMESNDETTLNTDKIDRVQEQESVKVRQECNSPLYNVYEEMEITIDEVKPEIIEFGFDLNGRANVALEGDEYWAQQLEVKDATEHLNFEKPNNRQKRPRLAKLKKKQVFDEAPARTYQRRKKTSSRKRPSSYVTGVREENKKRKVMEGEDVGTQDKQTVTEVREENKKGKVMDVEDVGTQDILTVTEVGEENNERKIMEVEEVGTLYGLGKEEPEAPVTTDKSFDVNPRIKVFIDTDNRNQLRIYDKRHLCFYCARRYLNMNKHLLSKHQDQIDVSIAPQQSVKNVIHDSQKLIYVRRAGNFVHNVQVLASGKGDLILLKPSELYKDKTTPQDFLPCTDCLGFVHKNHLRHHHRKCALKPKQESDALLRPKADIVKRNLADESRALLSSALMKKPDKTFKLTILSQLTSVFGDICKKDTLIKMFGQFLMEEMKCLSINRNTEIKMKMQKLGCVLLTCRRIGSARWLDFSSCLGINCINLFTPTLKTLLCSRSREEDRMETCKSFFSDITLCVFLWRGKCVVERNLIGADKVLKFYYRFTKECMREMGYQKQLLMMDNINPSLKFHPDPPALPSAVIKLKQFLTQRLIELTNDLKIVSINENNKNLWHDLAESLICLICLFNAVEFNAIQMISIADYAVRPDWSIDDWSEYEGRMSPLVHHLAQKRFIFPTEYLGKQIMILITSDMKKAMDILISKRKGTSVCPKNPYVFAKQDHNIESTFLVSNCFHTLCFKNGTLNKGVMLNMKSRQYLTYITYIDDMCYEEREWTRRLVKTTKSWKPVSHKLLSQAFHMYEINEMFELNKELSGKTQKNSAHPSKELEESEIQEDTRVDTMLEADMRYMLDEVARMEEPGREGEAATTVDLLPDKRLSLEAASVNLLPEKRLSLEAASVNLLPEKGLSLEAASVNLLPEKRLSLEAASVNLLPEKGLSLEATPDETSTSSSGSTIHPAPSPRPLTPYCSYTPAPEPLPCSDPRLLMEDSNVQHAEMMREADVRCLRGEMASVQVCATEGEGAASVNLLPQKHLSVEAAPDKSSTSRGGSTIQPSAEPPALYFSFPTPAPEPLPSSDTTLPMEDSNQEYADIDSLAPPKHGQEMQPCPTIFALGAYLGVKSCDPTQEDAAHQTGLRIFSHFRVHLVQQDVVHCPNCGQVMGIRQERKKGIGWRFGCHRPCRSMLTPLKNTVLENVHLMTVGADQFVMVAFLWVLNYKRTEVEALLTKGVKPDTLVAWFNHFRDVAYKIAWHDFVMLGGTGDVVEIDVFKKKYRVGKQLMRGIRLFGGVSRTSKRVFGVIVANSSRDTLLPIMQDMIDHKSYICSDQWKEFLNLDQVNAWHGLGDHSVAFLEPQRSQEPIWVPEGKFN